MFFPRTGRKGTNMKQFQEYADTVIEELQQVFGCMTGESLETFLKAIKNSKRVFLLGVGREGLSTRAFTMRLMHLGKKAHWIWDDTMPGIQQDDLLICTSGSGEIGHEIYICQQAKQRGARLALITAMDTGTIQKLSDLMVIIPAEAFHAKKNTVPTQQLMGNLFEQSVFIFFDIISMMLKDQMKITDFEMEHRHRNIE